MYYIIEMYPILIFGNFLKSNDSDSTVRKLLSVILEKVLRGYRNFVELYYILSYPFKI